MIEQLEKFEKRFNELTELMASPDVLADPKQLQSLGKERASIEGIVTKYLEYRANLKGIEDTLALQAESSDEEMTAMIKEELKSLQEKKVVLEEELKEA